MPVKEIKSLSEFQNLINSGKVIFIDFWATWCGPCKTISPVFEKLAKENAVEGAEFYKVDVDDQQEIAQEVGIRAMPTFIAFKDGNKLGDLVGAAPQRLEALVRSGLNVV